MEKQKRPRPVLAFFSSHLLYFTRWLPCPSHSFLAFLLLSRLSLLLVDIPAHFPFYLPLLCNTLFSRFWTSGSFITCPPSIFSLSLIWHFCHKYLHLNQYQATSRDILYPSDISINILDRPLDSPALLSSHSFDQPAAFGETCMDCLI